MSTNIEAYTLLRASLALFKKPPSELEASELHQVESQAKNEYDIETRVLNSLEAAGVIIPEDALQHALDEVSQRFEDEQSFANALKAHGLTLESLKAALYRQCKVNAVMESVGARAPEVGDVDIGIFYHEHPEKFHSPEQRVARHILISINPDYPENSRDNALQRIQALAEKLKRKPDRFAELALKNSECPTALNGGELGAIVSGKLYPELDAALFALKENEISGVVETEIGFHLIQCMKIHLAKIIPLEAVAAKIRVLMQDRSRCSYQRIWLEHLPKAKA